MRKRKFDNQRLEILALGFWGTEPNGERYSGGTAK